VKDDICITLYKLGIVVLIIGLIALPLYYFGAFKALEPYNYCIFKRLVGIYCPGCGGTRALKALLSGDIAASLFYHPAVLYFTVFYIIFMLRMFLMLRFNIGKVSYKRVVLFIWLGIALILIQWAAKNTDLYPSDIDLTAHMPV
jgi:hypothetical protein